MVVCTSFSQASSLKNALERLLRKTLTAGKVGKPPTQLVGITSVGTERTDKFPYSLQNMLGKLDQRRQIEEVLINTVQQRATEPPLDYTLIKLGEFKSIANEFDLRPGDVLDDPTTVETAVETILQAVAFQPFARNSTMSVCGSVLASAMDEFAWDSAFLCLEGPEVWRSTENIGDVSNYEQLLEYISEWAELLASTRKGITTPIRAQRGISSMSQHLVEQQDGVQLLFLPTNTGKNYISKSEEKQREQDTGGKSVGPVYRNPKAKEGGIDVVIEVTTNGELRVRARRCNYANGAVIKELSEETIMKRLQEAMQVWTKEHV